MTEKAIFLDRDDTLIEDPGYINNPDQVKLLDGVPEALIEMKNMGYKLIIVSNQSGIARGILTEENLAEIHERLQNLLHEKGAFVDKIYYCPFHPDGVIPKYRRESNMRKPNPGMLLAAAEDFDIDLSKSWMLGNSDRDVEAGIRAGCKTILIDNPARTTPIKINGSTSDYRAINIKEAVNLIKMHNRQTHKHIEQPRIETIEQFEPDELQPQQPEEDKLPSQQPEPPTVETALESVKEQQPPAKRPVSDRVEELLERILMHLKKTEKTENMQDFSIWRLFAYLAQCVAIFCLFMSIWFLLRPDRPDNVVTICLGFAAVTQMMALTFYIMQGRNNR